MSEEQIEAFAAEHIGRPIVVVGAATGTDTHSVGIDAMLNLKGFHGHHGLEGYRAFETHNLGSQVPNSVLVSRAIDLHADAILVSQTVTQQNLHVANLTELVEIVEAEGRRRQLILTCGGPRGLERARQGARLRCGLLEGHLPVPRGELHRARAGQQRSADSGSAWPISSLGDRRLALVGLAKNTGKTETLGALLRRVRRAGQARRGDLDRARRRGARRHRRAHRQAAHPAAGGGSRGKHSRAPEGERRQRTSVWRKPACRTPLGEVVIARLAEPGAIEVAGPSAAADVREVSDAMLGLGAEQVLIDGAIDRRAASSPAVADGLVLATGAILARTSRGSCAITRDAVDLVRLPRGNRRGGLARGSARAERRARRDRGAPARAPA